jgi:C4-dicarboxylate-specific signal transduction histidine kinase
MELLESTLHLFNPADVIREELSRIRNNCISGNTPISVSDRITQSRVMVAGVESGFRVVVANLVRNAIESLESSPTPGEVVVTMIDQDASVVIRVDDNGPGISPAVIDHLFEPFITTRNMRQAIGLGLYICKGIVQMHGGTIHGALRNEGGASFEVHLPTAKTGS